MRVGRIMSEKYHILSITFPGGPYTGGERWAYGRVVEFLNSIVEVVQDIPYETKSRPVHDVYGRGSDSEDEVDYEEDDSEESDSLMMQVKKHKLYNDQKQYLLTPFQHRKVLLFMRHIHQHPMHSGRGLIRYLQCPLSGREESVEWRRRWNLGAPMEDDANLCKSCRKDWPSNVRRSEFMERAKQSYGAHVTTMKTKSSYFPDWPVMQCIHLCFNEWLSCMAQLSVPSGTEYREQNIVRNVDNVVGSKAPLFGLTPEQAEEARTVHHIAQANSEAAEESKEDNGSEHGEQNE